MVKKKGGKDSIFLLVGIVAALFVLFTQNPDFSGEAVRKSPVTATGYLDPADRFGLFYKDEIKFKKIIKCMAVASNGGRSSVQKIRCEREVNGAIESKNVPCPTPPICSTTSCSNQAACGAGWTPNSVKNCKCI